MELEFTHFLTLTPTGMGVGQADLPIYGLQSSIQTTEFIKLVELYLHRLSERVYGRKRLHKRIKGVSRFEDRSKGGVPCHPHWHGCLIIEPEFVGRFEKVYEAEWSKVVYQYRRRQEGRGLHPSRRHYSVLAVPYRDNGAIEYTSKQQHINDYPEVLFKTDIRFSGDGVVGRGLEKDGPKDLEKRFQAPS